ncbi:hypothetical protein BCR43DRAFT_447193 [Syncephalastrum racemosum]|uniref:FAD/NAD(P)-binding domain-containing protein n=1 Tax=Syncephalastrum racemosum TaxID=13706 RepID=A0A1X2H0G8_SYNRA|nr:hypothetical protein BCR43DRAFT_447193 [Syncephalastrum racemosum]
MKNIVVVGGGYAGVAAAQGLESQVGSQYRILLVEKKTHFYNPVAGARASVEEVPIFVPYDRCFKQSKNKVIHATAERLEPHTLHLSSPFEGSTELAFEYLVLATGTRYPAPSRVQSLDLAGGQAELAKLRQNIREAKRIVVVGAGPVGIELVGEIVENYPEKRVTVIHNNQHILDDTFPVASRTKFTNRMIQKNKVDVLLNETVLTDGLEPGKLGSYTVSTKSGKSVECDLVLLAFGNRPDSDWLKDTPLLSKNGCVRVNKETLQVNEKGWEHVFALGDVADLGETKLAFRIKQHTPVLVGNLVRATENKPLDKKYKKGPDVMLVTFGKNGGIGQLPFVGTVGDWVARTLKSKTVFAHLPWETLHQTMPKQPKKASSSR